MQQVFPLPLPPLQPLPFRDILPAWRSVLSRRFATAPTAPAATNGNRTNRARFLRAEEGGVTPGGACVRRPVGPDQAEAADPASSKGGHPGRQAPTAGCGRVVVPNAIVVLMCFLHMVVFISCVLLKFSPALCALPARLRATSCAVRREGSPLFRIIPRYSTRRPRVQGRKIETTGRPFVHQYWASSSIRRESLLFSCAPARGRRTAFMPGVMELTPSFKRCRRSSSHEEREARNTCISVSPLLVAI